MKISDLGDFAVAAIFFFLLWLLVKHEKQQPPSTRDIGRSDDVQ